jgi:hypothetical protein
MNKAKPFRTFLLVLLTVEAILFLLMVLQRQLPSLHVPDYKSVSPQAGPSVTVPDPSNLLLYPGSEFVGLDKRSDHIWRRATYKVPDSPEEVRAYYADTLLKEGWRLVTDVPNPIYTWSEQTGTTPWNLTLTISFQIFEDEATGYDLLVYRSPDVSDIPLYAGAESVERIKYEDLSGEGVETSTIKYVVEATPRQIDLYYRSTLPLAGWVINADTASTDSLREVKGLIFNAGSIPTRGPFGTQDLRRASLSLLLSAHPLRDGKVNVVLQLTKVNIANEF